MNIARNELDPPPFEALTPREREVLAELAKGRTSGGIAKAFGISSATVSTHVRHIYLKLDIGSRAEAALAARALNLV